MNGMSNTNAMNRAMDNIKRFVNTGDDLAILNAYFGMFHKQHIYKPIDPREDAYMEKNGALCYYVREIGLYAIEEKDDPDTNNFTQFNGFNIKFMELKSLLSMGLRRRDTYGLQHITIEHIENKRVEDFYGNRHDVSFYRIKLLGV